MALTGSQKFAIFLCKVKNSPDVEPHPVSYYQDLFVNRGTGGLNDYWIAASHGAINLDGSQVFGWKVLDVTLKELEASYPSRWGKILHAFSAFPEATPADFAGYVAIYNVEPIDSGNQNAGVVAGPAKVYSSFLAHEMGHAMGFSHSFDYSDRIAVPEWPSAPGEYYDMFDIMSADNVYSDSGHRFSPRGPMMNVANMNQAGWIPANRVYTVNGGNSDRFTVEIVALEHPEVEGFLMVKAGGVLVEFRINDRFDRGLPQPTVLIHDKDVAPNSYIVASNAATYDHTWLPGMTHGNGPIPFAIIGGIRITVENFDLQRKTARLRIHVKAARKNLTPYADAQVDFGLETWRWPMGGHIVMDREGRVTLEPADPAGGLAPGLRAFVREQMVDILRTDSAAGVPPRTSEETEA